MTTAAEKPLTVNAVAGSAWLDFRRARRALLVFDVSFKLVQAWLLVPAVALVLSAALAGAGRDAVGNRDVVDFLLTPMGLLYAAFFATVALALVLFEQAGIMLLAAPARTAERVSVRRALLTGSRNVLRVIQLGAVEAALLALTLVPFALAAFLTYTALLSAHDINYYLEERPPTFWLAVAIGVLLGLAALAAVAVLYVRWAFALPVLLFEGQSARAALRTSRERVRGAGWRVARILLGWLLGALLLGAALQAGFRLLAAALLDNAGERPVVLILVLLLAHAVLIAAVSFVTAVGQGLLTRRLYLLRGEQLGILRPDGPPTAPDTAEPPPRGRWLLYVSAALLLLAPLALWASLSRSLADRPPVQATAHRGYSRVAPENTLAAIRKAIDSGADYAEIDVQLTADGTVVLLHDRDLKRVAGDPRRIDEITYDEVRRLDAGAWFGPEFVGERVPTLVEVIDLARGRIKLNIELKYYGADRHVAGAVAHVIRDKQFEADCLVTSFEHEVLMEARRHDPRLRTGLIVATALGDVSRLEGDALSVRADWLSDGLLREAHRRGKEVHVWTVNDAGLMARMMKRGVDNIITDDPELLIRVRADWAGRTGAERLVLASRLLLGLDP